VAELNAPGAFRGRIIKAENIGQSSDDLARRTACVWYNSIVGINQHFVIVTHIAAGQ
jgi:hypothetical protein